MIYFTVLKNTPIIRREVVGFARRCVSVLGVIFKLTTPLLFLAPFHRPRNSISRKEQAVLQLYIIIACVAALDSLTEISQSVSQSVSQSE
jgi:formate-dependent nitrite reductase membrane component NrfD